ncbi:rod shape-determining protein MreD [uncultured Alistipes sp.]|jgi:rod shape-determining protein mreD|uniref:rod shape-determining protein MreD n=1 Tax=uncultured Alistipes sp. TaxID=538949 RepID=UPI0025D06929|nr:rod shape-determining protein MreD [uncultured Alistipes sp.]
MHRTLPYLALFVVLVLLQVFLFDNLTVSIYLNPLVYVALIALLPLDTPPVVMLGAGLAMGVTMDFTMGAAGLNTIATLLIAFARPTILGMMYSRDEARDEGVPGPARLGKRVFLTYLIVLVLVHHTVFFALETLSWTHLAGTLLRIVVSSAVSVSFIWIITQIFTAKLPARV